MMTVKLVNSDPIPIESTKQNLVDILLTYLRENLENTEWLKFLQDPTYISLQFYERIYGNRIFHDLVNLASTYLSIEIPVLLEALVQHKLDIEINDIPNVARWCERSNFTKYISYGII